MDQSDDGQRRAAEQVGDTTRGQKSTTPLRLIATPAAAPRGRYPAEHWFWNHGTISNFCMEQIFDICPSFCVTWLRTWKGLTTVCKCFCNCNSIHQVAAAFLNSLCKCFCNYIRQVAAAFPGVDRQSRTGLIFHITITLHWHSLGGVTSCDGIAEVSRCLCLMTFYVWLTTRMWCAFELIECWLV